MDLKVEQAESLRDSIKRYVEVFRESISEYIEKIDYLNQVYEGKNALGIKPFDDWVDIHTSVASVACDITQARLYGTIWDLNKVEFVNTNRYFAENTRYVNKFMRHILKWIKMGDVIDKILGKLVREGSFFTRTYFDVKAIHGYEKTRKVTLMGVKEYIKRKTARQKIPVVEVLDQDDILFPSGAKSLDLDKNRILLIRQFYTYADLIEMQERGEIEGVDDEMKAAVSNYFRDSLTVRKNARGEIKDTDMAMEFDELTTPLTCYIFYLNTNKYSEDKKFRKYIGFYAYEANKILYFDELAKTNNFEDTLLRCGVYKERGKGVRGVGLLEEIEPLQVELDIIHSHRVNAQNLVIAPFFFYRPASNVIPEKIKIGLGVGIPLSDPQRDVVFPKLGVTNFHTSLQDEQFLLALIERKTMVSAYQIGRESDVVKSRATASGTLAIISQGQQNFQLLARRIADSIESVIESVLILYQSDAEAFKQARERILEEEGADTLDIPEKIEDILGNYKAQITIDPATGNKFMRREMMLAMFQLLAQDPFVNKDPARAWRLRKMLADAWEIDNVEELIGPMPPSAEASAMEAKEEYQMMKRGAKVMPKDGQDHFYHLLEHSKQLASKDFAEEFPEENRWMFYQHIKDTQEKLIEQLEEEQIRMIRQMQQAAINGENGGAQNGEQNGQSPQGIIPNGNMGAFQGTGAGSMPRPHAGGSVQRTG